MKTGKKRQLTQATGTTDTWGSLDFYRPYLSPTQFDMLSAEMDQPLQPTIRVNPLKTCPGFLNRLAKKYGWTFEQIPFCSTGYRVSTDAGPGVSATLEHKLGLYYVQEAASMLPVELFNLSDPGDGLSLDLAASPGGKTTHLISRMRDRGLVIANDASAGRIQSLRIVLQNWGALCTAVTRLPGEAFGRIFPGVFDRALLDAPCSMQGLRTAESHQSRPVTQSESRQLSSRQVALLTSAVQAVRVGGEVVYSTCTLLPGEDEAVVNAVLEQFPASLELLDARLILSMDAPGLSGYDGADFLPVMERTLRLWPHLYQTAGFFACVFRKTAETPALSQPFPSRQREGGRVTPLGHREQTRFCETFFDDFGFDLTASLAESGSILASRYEQVHILPALLLERFHALPVQSAGLLLGQSTPDGFQPSYEWVSRFGAECARNTITLSDSESARWIAGDNLRGIQAETASTNRYRIILNGENYGLGCGKNTNIGLKNLFPRRLVR